jgi:hypothetical protein
MPGGLFEQPSNPDRTESPSHHRREVFDPTIDTLPSSLRTALAGESERGAVVVTAVAEIPHDRHWPELVSLRIAEMCGEQRPSLLIDLGIENPTLHEALGRPDQEGIADVLLFSASLGHVAQRVREGAFSFVSAGTVVGDAGALLSHDAWPRLLDRQVGEGTTVVLHVPLDAEGAHSVVARADVVVMMGGRADASAELMSGFSGPFVWLEPPTPTGPDSFESDSERFRSPDVPDEASTPERAGVSPSWHDSAHESVVGIEEFAPEESPTTGAETDDVATDAIGEDFAQEGTEAIDALFTESDPEPEEEPTDQAWATIVVDEEESWPESPADELREDPAPAASRTDSGEEPLAAVSSTTDEEDATRDDENLDATWDPPEPWEAPEPDRPAESDVSPWVDEFEGLPIVTDAPSKKRAIARAVILAAGLVIVAATIALTVPFGPEVASESDTGPSTRETAVEAERRSTGAPAGNPRTEGPTESASTADPQLGDPLQRVRGDRAQSQGSAAAAPADDAELHGGSGQKDSGTISRNDSGAEPTANTSATVGAEATSTHDSIPAPAELSGDAADDPAPRPEALPDAPPPIETPDLSEPVTATTPVGTEPSPPETDASAEAVARAEPRSEELDAAAPQPSEPGAQPPPPVEATPPPPSDRPSGLMAFGLVVGSHWGLDAALQRAATLRDGSPGTEFIVVPLEADGTVLYRVLAGPAATSAEAQRLRVSLSGLLEDDGSESPIVSTQWAFLLGAFEDYSEAVRRVAEAKARGIPAYISELPVSGGRVIYRAYAGAFGSESESITLSRLLDDAGLTPAPLTQRIGRPTR